MNLDVVRLNQRISILLRMNKHRLQSLLLCFVLQMIDQRKLFTVFKATNKIRTPLEIIRSVNTE